MTVRSQLDRLAAQEEAFLGAEFIAPHTGNGVAVKVGSIVCRMEIEPRSFRGWGIFRPIDYRRARQARVATEQERERYLSLLPPVRLLAADGRGMLANRDSRMVLSGLAPIMFMAGVETFDTIVARFDGQQFWFDCLDSRRDPRFAAALRESLAADSPVTIPGTTLEERELLALLLQAKTEQAEAERRERPEHQIRSALSHAGAVMRSYLERDDGYAVEYTVDGQRHTSFVDKKLRVRSAGICLTGRDADFSLASLVSVLREGEEQRAIVRVGANRDHEDDYDE